MRLALFKMVLFYFIIIFFPGIITELVGFESCLQWAWVIISFQLWGFRQLCLEEQAVPAPSVAFPEIEFQDKQGQIEIFHLAWHRGVFQKAEASAGCEVCEGAEGMTEPLKQCTAWLRAYFCEPARTEQLPVPPFHHPLLQQDSFTKQVLWTLLRDVKFGEAISYQKLADLAGNSRAARAVGGAMRSNPRCTSRCYREKRNLLREPRLRKLVRGSAVLTFSVIPVPEI
uniref:Methylated-DNA--protein-cysteine methyltransferase n=1 Tax=Anas platyrhynchos platyrhynchos TaxID=8840 RepID=A0A493TAZ4_ANAPP